MGCRKSCSYNSYKSVRFAPSIISKRSNFWETELTEISYITSFVLRYRPGLQSEWCLLPHMLLMFIDAQLMLSGCYWTTGSCLLLSSADNPHSAKHVHCARYIFLRLLLIYQCFINKISIRYTVTFTLQWWNEKQLRRWRCNTILSPFLNV